MENSEFKPVKIFFKLVLYHILLLRWDWLIHACTGIYIYIYIYTHTYLYIDIYICVCVCVCDSNPEIKINHLSEIIGKRKFFSPSVIDASISSWIVARK